MGRILIITDDPGRNGALVRELGAELPCRTHNLYADQSPAAPAAAIVANILDLTSDAMERLRRLLGQVRRDAPLVFLLYRHATRGRMLAIALDATHTFAAPLDLARLKSVLSQAVTPASADARQGADAARLFYSSVFVAERPPTPEVIDTGTSLVERAVEETGIRDWVRAVRRFDDATHQHCLLVAGLAAAFATHLHLGSLERHRLTKAALLHDVGKIYVPAAILNKPGKLDDAETAVVRRHPEMGYRMLAGQGFAPELLSVVRSHHEMLDGSGYPDGLRGGEIPDLVRLITVCDIHAALIERRSCKPPMDSQAAYAILEGMAGRLDHAVVRAFRPVADGFTFSPPSDA